MKLELKPFDFAQAVARAGLRTDGQPVKPVATESLDKASFSTAMTQALRAVSDAQLESSAMQRELQMDNPTVSLEQTMIAMQKSQIGFTAAMSVRNRLVQAYTDIMNMQV
jgi:flagellar hook-basal body complex protein FliE